MRNKFDSLELGQFIPLHYHHNMLNDTIRMKGFKEAINPATSSTVDWHTQYIILPLSSPLSVSEGEYISIRFNYQGGSPLNALTDSLEVCHVSDMKHRSVERLSLA